MLQNGNCDKKPITDYDITAVRIFKEFRDTDIEVIIYSL